MARSYTDEEKAAAYVMLQSNDGNMKRTARGSGIPVTTLRRWKAEWDESPPDTTLVAEQATAFLDRAEEVREKALNELERKLPDATPSALVAAVGMLTDKIAMARGLATSRTETVHALPPAEDIAKTLGTVLQAALEAANARQEDIIDAEVVEQAPLGELPPAV